MTGYPGENPTIEIQSQTQANAISQWLNEKESTGDSINYPPDEAELDVVLSVRMGGDQPRIAFNVIQLEEEAHPGMIGKMAQWVGRIMQKLGSNAAGGASMIVIPEYRRAFLPVKQSRIYRQARTAKGRYMWSKEIIEEVKSILQPDPGSSSGVKQLF